MHFRANGPILVSINEPPKSPLRGRLDRCYMVQFQKDAGVSGENMMDKVHGLVDEKQLFALVSISSIIIMIIFGALLYVNYNRDLTYFQPKAASPSYAVIDRDYWDLSKLKSRATQ